MKNHQLRDLFKCMSKEDQIAFSNKILTIRPINTTLLHSMFQFSIVGSIMESLNRFNRITSIVKMVGMNNTKEGKIRFSVIVKKMDNYMLMAIFNL